MKTLTAILLSSLFILTILTASGQGTAMRATNGIGYGTTVINSMVGKITTGNVTNAAGSRVAYLEDVTGATNAYSATATNIAAYQAFLATNNYAATATNIAYHVALGLTNISGQNVRYPTNLGNATYIDVGNKYQGFATNDNISIAGCANVDASGTNVSWGILTITNMSGSGAVKTITIPAAWVDVDNLGGTTIYNTNQGILSVMVYPFLGTNFIWRGK